MIEKYLKVGSCYAFNFDTQLFYRGEIIEILEDGWVKIEDKFEQIVFVNAEKCIGIKFRGKK